MPASRSPASGGDIRTRQFAAAAASAAGSDWGPIGDAVGEGVVMGGMGGGGGATAVERSAVLPPHWVECEAACPRAPQPAAASAPSAVGRQRPLGGAGSGGRGSSRSRPRTTGAMWREDSFPLGEVSVLLSL